VRARLLEEAALTSATADLIGPAGARAECPECGQPLTARGTQERTVVVQGEQAVRLRRRYGVCPACGAGLFPPR
jgi:YgiT-type zinc finger domain-containing protein